MKKLVVSCLILTSTTILAQTETEDLTQVEVFRLNARAIGLGGSLVVQARDPSAIYWNPAALYGLKGRGILISVNNPFTFNFVSVTQFVPLFGTFGLALSRVSASPEKVDRGTLAWGRKIYKRISFGTKLDFLKQKDEWFSAAGAGVLIGNANIGALDKPWRDFFDNRFLDKVSLGVTVHNLPLNKKIFEPSAMIGFSYLFRSAGLMLNSGYHIKKGKNTNHLGLGFELNSKVRLFSGIEELEFDKFAVGMEYTRDNFVFNFAYSKQANKFLFTLSARISPAPSSLAEKYYIKGFELLEKKKYRAASLQLRKYLDFELYNDQSSAVDSVVNLLTTRLERTSSVIDSLLALSEKLLAQENPKFFRAAYVLTRIKELDPDNLTATIKLNALKPAIDVLVRKSLSEGIAEFEADQYFTAQKFFKRVLLFEKSNPAALSYLERIDQVLADLAEEYFFRGVGYYRDKNYQRAKEELERSLEISPQKTEAISYLSKTNKRIQENIKLISKLLREGLELEQRAKYVRATNKYLHVLKIDRENAEANTRISKLRPRINRFIQNKYSEGLRHYQSENFARAIEAFSNVLSIDPEHKNAKRDLAKALNDRKQKANSYVLRAETAFKNGEWQLAFGNYSRALQIEPANSKAIQGKTETEKKLQIANLFEEGRRKNSEKKYLEAVKIFDNILKMDPSNHIVLIELNNTKNKIGQLIEKNFNTGINLFTLDRYDEAIEVWNQVLALNPNHKGALEYKQKAMERIQALKRIRQ